MPKRLAEIVVETTLASRSDVVRAAKISDDEHVPLVVALVRQIGIDELALVSTIKRHLRITIPDPATVEHDPDAIRELSRDTCWRLRVMPLSVSYSGAGTKTLHVAMADPTDTVAMAEIEHLTGGRVEPSLMPLSAVEEMVERAYKAFVTEVMPRRKRSPFGSDLEVTTQPMARVSDADATGPTKAIASVPDAVDPDKPSTVPHHRVAEEASLELRHRALLELLVEREIITTEDYEDRVRALMKQRDADS